MDEDTDILVNCTSIGLYPDTNVPNINYNTLKSTTVVCDIIPNPLHTRFMAKAQACGCKTLDGFSMLINQAAVSFVGFIFSIITRERSISVSAKL